MKLGGQCSGCAGSFAQIAPSETCTIVAADVREFRYFCLNLPPIERRGRNSRFQNDRRRACSNFVEVEFMAPDIYESSGSGEAAFVVLQSDGLKEQSSGSQQCKRDNEDDGIKHRLR